MRRCDTIINDDYRAGSTEPSLYIFVSGSGNTDIEDSTFRLQYLRQSGSEVIIDASLVQNGDGNTTDGVIRFDWSASDHLEGRNIGKIYTFPTASPSAIQAIFPEIIFRVGSGL